MSQSEAADTDDGAVEFNSELRCEHGALIPFSLFAI